LNSKKKLIAKILLNTKERSRNMLTGVRLERPRKVGSYVVGDVIGKGATGTVYKG